MEKGVVKFFDSRDGKKFGFVVTESGEEIFFHQNDGERMIPGRTEPEFSGSGLRRAGGKTFRLREPLKDDQIVFSRGYGSKGVKACPWSFVSSFDLCAAAIASRPKYRVTRTERDYFGRGSDPLVKVAVVWEGTDIISLSSCKPKRSRFSSYAGRTGNDSLGSGSIEDGLICWQHTYEVLKEGEWVKCEDPRLWECCVPKKDFSRINFGYRQSNSCPGNHD